MQNTRQEETLENYRGKGIFDPARGLFHPAETCWKENPGRIHLWFMEDFATAGVCTSGWYFLKGVYNSPSGARLLGGSQALRLKAPRLPLNSLRFALFCGLSGRVECGMAHARRKEDAWNTIIGCAVAFGALPLLRHGGLRQILGLSAASVLFGGVFCEGAVIAFNKVKAQEHNFAAKFRAKFPRASHFLLGTKKTD